MAEPAQHPIAQAHDIRPSVARASSNRSLWIFAAVLAAAGGGIFYALQMNRLDLANQSAIAPEPSAGGIIASPHELAIPLQGGASASWPGSGLGATPSFSEGTMTPAAVPGPTRSMREPPRAETYAPPPASFATPPSYGFPQAQGPAVAYQSPVPLLPAGQDGNAAKSGTARVQAGRLDNPSTTVPQGSVIQAVMETALDSTRAGFARAIVSRNVVGFDGTRVLIPRGSKLFGEYQADVSLGQKRALIQWRRLTLPDGTIMDIDSPSADPLGKAGVKGKVNTHFFQRFSGAILQSILDVGVRAATREAAGDTVIVGLPGSISQAATIQNPADIKPTLKIPQGASVSVMVARDLDFSSAES